MRDPKRIDVLLKLLEAYWKKYPDLRLGQIVGNIAWYERREYDPFFVEDDKVIDYLTRHLGYHQ